MADEKKKEETPHFSAKKREGEIFSPPIEPKKGWRKTCEPKFTYLP